jgi:hypothetical protein
VRWRLPAWAVAAAIYVVLGVVAWAHAWAAPSSSLPAPGSDPSQQAWFLEWGAFAVAHGHNPFFTSWINVPEGVNMVSNASDILLSVLLAPITWTGGPVLSAVVALTLAPSLSALSAFYACRRFAPYGGAAFVGGLVYGFSPDVLNELRGAHLYLTFLALPPLMLIVVDAIVVGGRSPGRTADLPTPPPGTSRRRSAALGLILGMLVVGQFLISVEVLAMTLVIGAIGVAVIGVAHARRGSHAGRRSRDMFISFATAFVVAAPLLAYPLWVFLAGPEHFSGTLFPQMNEMGSTVLGAVIPGQSTSAAGYVGQGNTAYLGIILVVLVAAAPFLRRDEPVLRFAALMCAVAFVLSTGYYLFLTPSLRILPMPAWVLGHLPITRDILPYRFASFTALFAAILVAIVLDRVHARGLAGLLGDRLRVRARWGRPRAAAYGTKAADRSRTSTAAVVLLAGLVLLPIALNAPLPFRTGSITVPAALRSPLVAALPEASVIIEYPLPTEYQASPMAWQALSGMRYRLVGGYAIVESPDGRPEQIPPAGAVSLALIGYELGGVHLPRPTKALELAIRDDIGILHVAALVVLDEQASTPPLLSFLTATLARRPAIVKGGWVWLFSPNGSQSSRGSTGSSCRCGQRTGRGPRSVLWRRGPFGPYGL